MKIDRQGIEEIKSTIETPVRALAERLESKKKLDKYCPTFSCTDV